MSDSTTYSVILSGNIKPGFETDKVIAGFAKLFVVPFDQATRVVGTEYVVKKEISLQQAEVYRDRIEDIGLEVTLQRHDDIDDLSLAPIAAPVGGEADTAETPRPLPDGHMRCPACNLEQPEAEQCSGCGVYMSKVAPVTPADGEVRITQHVVGEEGDDEAAEAATSRLRLFIAPAIVALLGALLWYLVAAMLEMEFGAVALLIGFAVSYAATRGGAGGTAVGVGCAVLVVLSICAGKLMYLADLRFDWNEAVDTVTELEGIDLYRVYAREVEDARQFGLLPGDDASLLQFLVERKYSKYRSADDVPYEEVRAFRASTQPRLEKILAARPTFEQWRELNFYSEKEETSTFGLMISSVFGRDIVFLILGVAIAFVLAYRGRKVKYA